MARIGTHANAVAVRAALVEAVARLGADRADADPRLRPLLIDLTDASNEARRWIGMITEVADLGLVVDLTDQRLRDDAQARICDETALSADAARWAIEAWCEALGIEAPPERPMLTTPALEEARRAVRARRSPAPTPDGLERPGPPLIPDGLGTSGHLGLVAAAAVSPDGHLLATGDADGGFHVQSLDGAEVFITAGPEGTLTTALAFSPDNGMVASGGEDGTVRVWDTTLRRPHGVLAGDDGGVSAVAFNPDATMLAVGTASGTITLWSVPDGTRLRQITGHPDAVRTLAFRSGVRVLVSGGDDQAVRMWLSETGTRGHVLERNGPVGALALSPDGRFLAAAEPARVAVRRFAWPPSPVEITATVGQVLRGDVFFLTGAEVTDDHAGVRTLAFEPAGELVAAGTHDGSVMVWRPGAGADTGRAAIDDAPVVAVAFTGGGSRLVSVGSDGSIRFWRWRR